CEVEVALAEADLAELRQPTTTPDPVPEYGVDDHADECPEEQESGPFPPFGHGTGGNSSGGVHEDHLEEEHYDDADVEDVRAEEEPLETNNPPPAYGQLLVQNSQTSEIRHAGDADAAKHEGEAADPVPEHAD